MAENDNFTSGEAKDALDSVRTMERAGYRRAVPRRWFGATLAFLIACLFALYALENPYPYIVFPIIGMGMLIAASHENLGAYGRDFPGTKVNRWALVLFAAVMVAVFFGMIFIRRAYDLSWVPIVVGLLVGLIVLVTSEHERRAYLAKASEGSAE